MSNRVIIVRLIWHLDLFLLESIAPARLLIELYQMVEKDGGNTRKRERERERERQRERETERQRQTDRQTDRQRERERGG